MLIPSLANATKAERPSLSRRVNANSQPSEMISSSTTKLIKKGEC